MTFNPKRAGVYKSPLRSKAMPKISVRPKPGPKPKIVIDNVDDQKVLLMIAELQDIQNNYEPGTSIYKWIHSAIFNLDGVASAISVMKEESDSS